MSKHKIQYEVKFTPCKEAVKLFKTEGHFLNALRDGTIIAFGDRCYDPTKEPTSFREFIPVGCWRDYKYNGKSDTLLGGVNEYGSDDPQEYRNIVVELSSLEALQIPNAKGRGAPAQYDWESFWRAVAFHLYAAEKEMDDVDSPISLRDWVRNAKTDYEYVWGSKENAPGETTIEDKLRPLWDAVCAESDKPLRDFVTKKANGGRN